MAELTHETAEEGFHEIQLSGKQLVFLFMLMTVVFVGIFLCGVLVGRSVKAARGDEPLGGPAQAVAGAGAEIPDTADAPAEPPVPPVEDELTYHNQLEGTTPKGRSQTRTPPVETPKAADPVKPPAARSAEIGSAAEAPAPKPAAPQQASAPTPSNGPSVPTVGRPGRWVVQVSALRNRVSAAEIVQSLVADGYPAFLVPPAAGSPPLYRIQIGRYNDRSEAEQIVRRLAREKQYKPEIKR